VCNELFGEELCWNRLKKEAEMNVLLEAPIKRTKFRKLTPQRLAQQRRKLLELRAALSRRIQCLMGEAREEVPIYSLHMGDAATDSFDRDLVLGLASFGQAALYEVDAALKRIEDGTYGICERTRKPIPLARLVAIPWARYCIGAEREIRGELYPHLGELKTIRPETTGILDSQAVASNQWVEDGAEN
jgi:RNA polymerase-binding transcription factor DksA